MKVEVEKRKTEEDNFPICDLLSSCYEVQDFLGEGTFGKVAKCVDTVSGTKVAIKITKDEPGFTKQVLEEVVVETSSKKPGGDKKFFKRIRRAFSRWFHRDNNRS